MLIRFIFRIALGILHCNRPEAYPAKILSPSHGMCFILFAPPGRRKLVRVFLGISNLAMPTQHVRAQQKPLPVIAKLYLWPTEYIRSLSRLGRVPDRPHPRRAVAATWHRTANDCYTSLNAARTRDGSKALFRNTCIAVALRETDAQQRIQSLVRRWRAANHIRSHSAWWPGC
jgi:hypothetical protein